MAVESRLAIDALDVAVRPRRVLDVAADYVALLKPRIVGLLVLTELAAMVTAARGWPHAGVLLGSLAGGALAAGGSGAVNCWFDRDIDSVMPRTRRRPVPAGRIPPAAALAFGILTAAAGVALIAWSSNLLAAELSVVGGLIYLFVYTMWLKRSTAQNIVIGGAAGAVPPLVGWAAVTGSLTPLAWLLFAIVFFWTPPHFWALALLLRRQYSAVKVPMLPVAAGSEGTRRAILVYTLILAAVSLTPTRWLGVGFGVAAAALDAGFIFYAVRAIRDNDGASALALFRYSLAYLALLFIAVALASAGRL